MRPASVHPDDITLPDLAIPTVARLGGLLLVATGLFGAAAGVQVFALFDGLLATSCALPVLAIGLGALIVAPFAYDGRGWATIVGSLLAFATAVISLGWIAWATLSLVFAPTLFLAFLTASASFAVLPFSIGPAIRLTSLRRALQA